MARTLRPLPLVVVPPVLLLLVRPHTRKIKRLPLHKPPLHLPLTKTNVPLKSLLPSKLQNLKTLLKSDGTTLSPSDFYANPKSAVWATPKPKRSRYAERSTTRPAQAERSDRAEPETAPAVSSTATAGAPRQTTASRAQQDYAEVSARATDRALSERDTVPTSIRTDAKP